jgi:hypothetical protein
LCCSRVLGLYIRKKKTPFHAITLLLPNLMKFSCNIKIYQSKLSFYFWRFFTFDVPKLLNLCTFYNVQGTRVTCAPRTPVYYFKQSEHWSVGPSHCLYLPFLFFVNVSLFMNIDEHFLDEMRDYCSLKVDIGEIVDHHCLNFFFIISISIQKCAFFTTNRG